MKRLALALSAVVAGLGMLALVLPWAISEQSIRDAASREIVALTGRVPVIAGHARLTLVPLPTVTLEDVTIPGLPGSPPLLQAASMQGNLSLPSLLSGSLDLSSISLDQPQISLIGRKDGERSWVFRDGALAKGAGGQRDIDLPVSSVRFVDGTVNYADARTQRVLVFKVKDGAVNWSSLGSGLSASAECEWRGQSIDLSLSVTDPAALLAGGRSDIRSKATSDLVRISLGGNLSGDGHLEGHLGLSSPSLRNVLRWGGLRLAEGSNIGAFKLQSPVSIDPTGLTLSASQLELDGNSAEGAMRLQMDGPRPKLSATLAVETLDVTPYAEEFRLADDTPQKWRREPIDLDTLSVADLDLRVSSAETILDKAKLGRTAAALVTQDGLLELSLGEAVAYGGMVKGRLTVRTGGSEKTRVEAQLRFDNVEMGKALADFFAFHRLEGTGSGTIEATATGKTVADLSHTLKGSADFLVENGTLLGVDLAELMQRVARRPLSASLESHSGRTPFEKGTAKFVIVNGVASTSDIRLDNGALRVTMDGWAGVPERSLDMAGVAHWQSDTAVPAIALPFHVSGDWQRPVVAPDTDTLIRRSGAAAPLFKDSIRAFTSTDNAAAVQSDMPAVIRPIESP